MTLTGIENCVALIRVAVYVEEIAGVLPACPEMVTVCPLYTPCASIVVMIVGFATEDETIVGPSSSNTSASSAGRYDYIMLTDVRDVVFQADPFAGVPADKARRSSLSSSSHDAAQPPPACARLQIIFSTESPTPTLGTCKYNSAAYKVRCASLQ